jgi:hypothetical protein
MILSSVKTYNSLSIPPLLPVTCDIRTASDCVGHLAEGPTYWLAGWLTNQPTLWAQSLYNQQSLSWWGKPGPPGWGSLKNRDSDLWSWVPWNSDLRKAALAMPDKNGKLQTRLLVREGAPDQQSRNCLKNNQRENGKNWSRVPDGCVGHWPTDCRS